MRRQQTRLDGTRLDDLIPRTVSSAFLTVRHPLLLALRSHQSLQT